ncbi:hypothetical protein [Mycobacterium sp. URHB0021]
MPDAAYHATLTAVGRYREPVEGTPFGRYQLIELLSRVGMGEVWRPYDSTIGHGRRYAGGGFVVFGELHGGGHTARPRRGSR